MQSDPTKRKIKSPTKQRCRVTYGLKNRFLSVKSPFQIYELVLENGKAMGRPIVNQGNIFEEEQEGSQRVRRRIYIRRRCDTIRLLHVTLIDCSNIYKVDVFMLSPLSVI